jgi:hypothetical protein
MKKIAWLLWGWITTAVLAGLALLPFAVFLTGLNLTAKICLSALLAASFWFPIAKLAIAAYRQKGQTGSWELPRISGGPSFLWAGRRHYTSLDRLRQHLDPETREELDKLLKSS